MRPFLQTSTTYVSLKELIATNFWPFFTLSEMEFKEFVPRFKSAKTRFKFSAGLNLQTFDTILSGTNHI